VIKEKVTFMSLYGKKVGNLAGKDLEKGRKEKK
jgi:hypothetical protein